MLKKLLIIFLSLILSVPYHAAFADTENFLIIREYNDNFASDISSDDWFFDYAVSLYKLGLSDGADNGFMPFKQLSIAEAVAFASRLHSIYYTGSTETADNFSDGKYWYSTYFDYASDASIIDDRFNGMENEPALRKYAAYIFSFVFPMENINSLSDSDIPDTDSEYSYYITKVYNSGIMNGTDTSLSFAPNNQLLRCEAAAIVSRCAFPNARIHGIEKSSFAANMPESAYSDGIIVVSSSGSGRGNFSFHKKSENGVWKELLTVPCYIGRNGLGKTAEGDGKTPSGTFNLGFAFGNDPNPGTALEYVRINNSHYWVDDSSSAYYNKFVSTYDTQPDWTSAEHLSSYPTAYAYAISVNYNPDCVPGMGSAIFIHCSSGGSTSGCIAIDRSSMAALLNSVTPNTVIVIG